MVNSGASLMLCWCASLPQVLLAAMQSQLLGDSRVANTLIPRVCNAVLAAPSSTRHVSCCGVGADAVACSVRELQGSLAKPVAQLQPCH